MNVHVILFMQLPIYVLLNSAIVIIEILVAIVELQIIIALFRHLFKLYFKWFIVITKYYSNLPIFKLVWAENVIIWK